MSTFTWIWSTIAIITLMVGAVSTIVIRTEITPNWRKISKVLIWIISLLVFKVVFWGIVSFYRQEKSTPPTIEREANSGLPVVQTEVEMELEWMLPDGQLDRGLNSDILVVKNLKYDAESMSFDTPYHYGDRTQVGTYYLEKQGDRYKGSWAQRAPADEGSIELKKVGELIWTGPYTDRTGRTMTATLRPKKK